MCTNDKDFSIDEFYEAYPNIVISRIGYPARAVFKSTWMWKLFGEYIVKEIGEITTYADIGGCFGFSANAMAFYISKRQGSMPRTIVFEISAPFIEIGSMLFPQIEFRRADFGKGDNGFGIFDLVTLFDVIEHVKYPKYFLRNVAACSRYLMLKTPMETSGEWRGNHPPEKQGMEHEDGHINFWTPKSYEKLLDASGLEIVASRLIPTIVPSGGEICLCPEQYEFKIDHWPSVFRGSISYSIDELRIVNPIKQPRKFVVQIIERFPVLPWQIKRKVLGRGDHLSLCKSHVAFES